MEKYVPRSQEEWETFGEYLRKVKYLLSYQGHREALHTNIVKYMEREHKKKRVEETPSASLESVTDDPPSVAPRKKRFNLQEAYDQKFIEMTDDIVHIQASLESIRLSFANFAERLAVCEQGLARIERNCNNVLQTKDATIADLRKRANEARDFLAALNEPFCGRCNEFGHHDC